MKKFFLSASPERYVLLNLRVKLDAADAKTMASCAVIWYWFANARTCSTHRRKMVIKRAVMAAARRWSVLACCRSCCLSAIMVVVDG